MKRFLGTIFALFVLVAADAQDIMRIEFKNKEVTEYYLEDIKDLWFRNSVPENLCIDFKDDDLVEFCVDDIDNITFTEAAPEVEGLPLPYTKSFASTLGDWKNYTTSGTGEWYINYNSAYATGYVGGQNKAGVFYLVSPLINLKGEAVQVTYNYILRYNRGNQNQQLLINENFDEKNPSVGWELLTQNHIEGSDWNTWAQQQFTIPNKYINKNVRFALRFECTSSASATWEVKDFSVKAVTEESLKTTLKADAYKRIEVPALTSNGLFVSNWTVEDGDSIMTYCYEFNKSQLHSNWVAYRFDRVTRQRNVSRTDAWADDPSLPSQYRIGTGTFSGYDRGHICPSADRLYSSDANKKTFYMSNMSPQLNSFNTGIWETMESAVRTKGQSATFADTLYVVKGGLVSSGQMLGYVNRTGGKRVAVPKYYFCAALQKKSNTYNAIGFFFEHRSYATNEKKLSLYTMSIDELEEKTGIDFFHNLPDDIETQVEKSYSATLWGVE